LKHLMSSSDSPCNNAKMHGKDSLSQRLKSVLYAYEVITRLI
jgi:hypothetical protein